MKWRMAVCASVAAAGMMMLGAAPAVVAPQAPAPQAPAPQAPAPQAPATRPTAAAASQPAIEPADQPVLRTTAGARWLRTHQQYVEKAKAGNIDLYMLGDSITDFWGNQQRFRANWEKNLGGWRPGDFGFSGDRTQHVLWRITNGELEGVKPKAIVVMIGTNNLPPHAQLAPNTPEETARGIKAIVDVLKEKQPQAKILLLAIFPRADIERTGPDIMDKVNKVNEIIATYDDGKQVKYLNINKHFLNAEGKLTKEVMPDLLHPSEKGYQIWADAIKPQLTEWLGPPTPTAATQPH
jgi:lysophospholipase L1-like esterase